MNVSQTVQSANLLAILKVKQTGQSALHFRKHKLKSVPLDYFFISSSTAAVIALTPVRNVGSGSGWNKLEWSEGSGLPDFLLASTLAGSIAPSQK